MKGNFMIQAELDITRHPEWGEYERWECLKRASVKERQLKWKLDTKNFNLDAMRYSFGLYTNQSIRFDLEYDSIWRPIHPNIILEEPWT